MPTFATLAAYSSWAGWIMAVRFVSRSSRPTSVCSAAMPYFARRRASMSSTCCCRLACGRDAQASITSATATLLPPKRIEDHRERPVRLPAMLRVEAVEHDASFAVRHRHRGGLAREVLGAVDPAGQQNVARVVGI